RRTGDLARRVRADYPLFWKWVEARWLGALRRFLERDLAMLQATGSSLIAVEAEVAASLALGTGRSLDLRGRLDRVARRGDGAIVITDYKTSGDLKERVGLTPALKGRQTQMPLYVLLAESGTSTWRAEGTPIEGEILGVGPSFSTDSASTDASGTPRSSSAAL